MALSEIQGQNRVQILNLKIDLIITSIKHFAILIIFRVRVCVFT